MAGKNQVVLTFVGDHKPLGKTLDKVGQDVNRFKGMAVGASLAVGAALIGIGVDSFRLGKDLEKLNAKAGAVFKEQLPSINRWAEQNKRAFGASRSQVVGLAANMADLLIPMGFTTKQAAEMSTKIIGLSGALSNWSGGTKTAAEVSDILAKALLGERDGLKGLGISISDADVKARLLTQFGEKGFKKLSGATLAQATALATQQLILEKSTDAQTAWANGGKAAAEKQNEMKVRIQETRESLARGLTPAFEVGTKAVSAFAGWAERNQGTVKILAGVLGTLAAVVLTVSAVTKVAAAVQAVFNIVMMANPIGLVIIAIVALVAIIVLIATKTRWFQNIWGAAWGWVKQAAVNVWDWLKALPGRIGNVFAGIGRFISAPFRAAFNFIADAWNNTVGRLSWSVPGWVPGIGGNTISAPRLPTFHTGGVVPGAPGTEMLAMLQAGERVTPAGRSGPMVLELRSSGARVDDLLVEILARAIKGRGGNVQVALGR